MAPATATADSVVEPTAAASSSAATSTGTAPSSTTLDAGSAGASEPAGTRGKTTIADIVVSKIAGLTTRDIAGVHDLGGSATRAVSALRERIPGSSVNHSQGISVEVGEKQAAIDIEIVAEYGVSIVDLAAGIRRSVITAIERTTGLEVVEVNITVHDIWVGSDEPPAQPDSAPASARVV